MAGQWFESTSAHQSHLVPFRASLGDGGRMRVLVGSAVTIAPPAGAAPRSVSTSALPSPMWRRRCREGLSRSLGQDRWLDAFVPDEPARIEQAGSHIIGFEPGELGKQRLDGISGGQHAQHVLHGQTSPSDDRLTAKIAGFTVIRCSSASSRLGIFLCCARPSPYATPSSGTRLRPLDDANQMQPTHLDILGDRVIHSPT